MLYHHNLRTVLIALLLTSVTGAPIWAATAPTTPATTTEKNMAPQETQKNTEDNQQDNSFFGKPGSTKRLYWYIGGGITVAVSIALLIHYLRNSSSNTPATPVAQPQGQPANTTYAQPADNTFELGFRFAQEDCPLNEQQKQEFRQYVANLIIHNPEIHNQMEDAVTRFMQQHNIQRPDTDFCEIGLRVIQEGTILAEFRGFGGGRYYGRQQEHHQHDSIH